MRSRSDKENTLRHPTYHSTSFHHRKRRHVGGLSLVKDIAESLKIIVSRIIKGWKAAEKGKKKKKKKSFPSS